MGDTAIRLATLEDVGELLRLEALFPSDRMDLRAVRRFIRTPSARFWVATSGQRLAGNLLMLIRHNSRSARIYSVIVDPDARGLGLGGKLVDVAEQEAQRLGRRTISLEVREDNVAALALYTRRGYQTLQKLPRFYDDDADGLRLIKPL